MTEQAYIDTRDLSNVMHAQKMLTEITIANQPHIPEQEYRDVLRKVASWQDQLFKAVKSHGTHEML